ncbi:MAG: NAD(P)H-hydrate dehydratase [Candidatus Omnitrophica bacterium]|nr:NAD(P)H-hydrate dehydratase [Candidatus Omnitrophota bacterium]
MPTPLLRRNKHSNKYDFGHALVLAGSRNMLGASALTGLAAMRIGAGLVTVGVPKSLNGILQKKLSNVIMTLSLPETKGQGLSYLAFKTIKKICSKYDALAIGPGLTVNPETKKLVLRIIRDIALPMVIDADALNALAKNPKMLLKNTFPKILTPHLWEMQRLTGLKKDFIEKNRLRVAKGFAEKYNCVLLLKGNRTIVCSREGSYINQTGNCGMATAGAGDVLTGIITGLLAQGINAFEAAKFGSFIHGLAGDLAAKEKTKPVLIASDIIDYLPKAIKACN